MIKLSLTADFSKLERSLIKLAAEDFKAATAKALTRTAASARRQVISELPAIFKNPVPFTMNSIRYKAADAANLVSGVYISDDAPKGTSPRKYLGPEIIGGPRANKGGENQLIRAGIMSPSQQLVPGSGMQLNAAGNIPGSTMVTIISRLDAFGEQGYQANASAATKRRLAKKKLAARKTGTNFFPGKGKWTGGVVGIFEIVSKGVVKPVLWFVDKKPNYKPIFHFQTMVIAHARANFIGELRRALKETIGR